MNTPIIINFKMFTFNHVFAEFSSKAYFRCNVYLKAITFILLHISFIVLLHACNISYFIIQNNSHYQDTADIMKFLFPISEIDSLESQFLHKFQCMSVSCLWHNTIYEYSLFCRFNFLHSIIHLAQSICRCNFGWTIIIIKPKWLFTMLCRLH